ncbi:MAG TPA: hypothetical protein VEH76_14485 [Methylocystis sp.]|nr:hypothetical protein [Methylocystis sp.]
MKRMSLRTLTMASTAIVLTSAIGAAFAQVPPPPATRTPQPWPGTAGYTYVTSPDGLTTTVTTPQGNFPSSDPWVNPTNLLPTVYDNVKLANGQPLLNSLSSTPQQPYNLHPDPVIATIDKTSPTDDLAAIFASWRAPNGDGSGFSYSPAKFNPADVQRALDILEGNPVPNRVYSGIPMIHYNGPNKEKAVTPTYDGNGNVTGGNVTIHQVWFDTHIESDTAFIDPTPVLNAPFTITYVIDVLNKGKDDFAPMQMYLDPTAVAGKSIPLVTMDMTFFPMEEGTRTTYQIALAPGQNYNLTYHWGWRRHPPRVAVTENAVKAVMGQTTWQWEINTFGANPRASQAATEAAIAKISDLAPSKRMWVAFRSLQQNGFNPAVIAQAERAFQQWGQRNELPDGVTADPTADITLFYADNTIYGHMNGYVVSPNAQAVLDKWHTRGTTVTIKLLNGDYFEHGFVSVDFGGLRGWENTFQNTLPVGGDGAFFTFGRAYWEMNTPTPIIVPPATPASTTSSTPPTMTPPPVSPEIYKHQIFWQDELDPTGKSLPQHYPAPTLPTPSETLGVHTLVLNLNYEPSLRLRLYQFDPLHHEQAIWSVH